jgi:hypothetical protein
MGTKKPLEPVIVVSDPRELAFLAVVRSLPPEALPALIEAMRMLVEKRLPHKTRSAWMRFFEAAGYPRSEWRERADGIMASGIRGT